MALRWLRAAWLACAGLAGVCVVGCGSSSNRANAGPSSKAEPACAGACLDATVPDAGEWDSGLAEVDDASPLPPSTGCPGPLTQDQAATLMSASGENPAGLAWLYPVHDTVFPGGTAPPTFQFRQTGTPDAVSVHMHSKSYDSWTCFSGSLAVTVSETEWATAYAQNAGVDDPLTLAVTTLRGSTTSGPVTENLTVAKGSLPGVIYYDTYGSKLAPGDSGVPNGAVIRVQGSAVTAVLYAPSGSSGCIGCHSVSSDGTTLAAQEMSYGPDAGLSGSGSVTFDLSQGSFPNPTPMASTLSDGWGLAAIAAKGAYMLTSGEPGDTSAMSGFLSAANDNPGMFGPKPSTLYNPRTGAALRTNGLTTTYAMMPAFSPDGKLVAFTEGDATAGGHVLTVMDVDFTAAVPFSNPRRVYDDGVNYPGWPSFTPDGTWVVFAVGAGNNFASEDPLAPSTVYASSLYMASTTGEGTPVRLDGVGDPVAVPGADGGASAGLRLDYYPSVLPVSTDGYLWVAFTSRRDYGNLYAKGPTDVGSKAIWVAAFGITGVSGPDLSKPAFYLPGQELGSGNYRPVASLAACKAAGAACEAGYDCCGGNCTMGLCGVTLSCAGEGDMCTPTVPCCSTGDLCLGGYCGFVQNTK